jgi:hypothetical protein
MPTVNRYLPASLNDANTQEVSLVLASAAQPAKKPGALEELVNSGPLSPEFSDAIRGRKPSAEPEQKTRGRRLF